MNIDSLLNIEQRTGIRSDDIDQFVNRASAIEDAIKAISEDKCSDELLRKAGFVSDEEKAEKERLQLEQKKRYDEKQAEQRARQIQEEKERWWTAAQFFIKKGDNDDENADESSEMSSSQKIMDRYNLNYSKWDVWEATSDARTAEEEHQLDLEEKAKNDAFEKSNPEFCKQFKDDMQNRAKGIKEKAESSNIKRLKANNLFKQGKFAEAIVVYMEALKLSPYDTKILMNIAQTHIKLNHSDEAYEFISRVLFIDSKNVKALSRKAFLLSMKGQYEAALEAAKVALAQNITNEELIEQVKTLEIQLKDSQLEDQLKLMVMNKAHNDEEAMVGDAKTADQQSSNTSLPPATLQWKIKIVDTWLNQAEKISSRDSLIHAVTKESLPELIVSLTLLSEILLEEEMLRVYFRTCGCLENLLVISKLCIEYFAEPKAAEALEMISMEENSKVVSNLPLLPYFLGVLDVLSSAICNNYSSGLLIANFNLLDILLGLLLSSKTMELNLRIFQVFLSFNSCEILHPSKSPLMSSMFVLKLSGLVQVHCAIYEAATSSSNKKTILAVLMVVSQLLRSVFMDEKCRQQLSMPTNLLSAVVVSNLAAALNRDVSLNPLVIEALVGLSQMETIRDGFLLPVVSSYAASLSPKSSIECLLFCLLKSSDEVLISNGVAVLMNISLDSQRLDILQEILKGGGLQVALSGLSMNSPASSSVSQSQTALISRKAGLLSRLVNIDEVKTLLVDPSMFQSLANAIHCIDKEDPSFPHYIRALASISNLPPHCYRIADSVGLISDLVNVFPMPRSELGEITAQSVILHPEKKVSAVLLGNLARCLMHLANDEQCLLQMFADKQFTTEKIICAFATHGDIKVRKNLAILLAKGSKIPFVREKMNRLRGMQMLMQMQNQLVN